MSEATISVSKVTIGNTDATLTPSPLSMSGTATCPSTSNSNSNNDNDSDTSSGMFTLVNPYIMLIFTTLL